MTKTHKTRFVDAVKGGVSSVSRLVATSVFPHITEGADKVMKNIDERILRIEQRLLRKVRTRLVLLFGCVFLFLALFFSFREYLGWSEAAVSFAIGITLFVAGLLLVIAEP